MKSKTDTHHSGGSPEPQELFSKNFDPKMSRGALEFLEAIERDSMILGTSQSSAGLIGSHYTIDDDGLFGASTIEAENYLCELLQRKQIVIADTKNIHSGVIFSLRQNDFYEVLRSISRHGGGFLI